MQFNLKRFKKKEKIQILYIIYYFLCKLLKLIKIKIYFRQLQISTNFPKCFLDSINNNFNVCSVGFMF